MENLCVCMESAMFALAFAMAAVSILQVPLFAARAMSARRKPQVRRWFESPSDGAMLLRTQRICCASVASLLSMALAQWTRSCSMQFTSPKLPRDFDVGKPGHGRVRWIWLLFIAKLENGVIWCKEGGGVSVVQMRLQKQQQKRLFMATKGFDFFEQKRCREMAHQSSTISCCQGALARPWLSFSNEEHEASGHIILFIDIIMATSETNPESGPINPNMQHSGGTNYILNGLDNALYNVYSPMVNAKALWESLERKYKTEDTGSKKFVVGKFLDFKKVDSMTVISQVQEFQLILHDIHAEWMVLGESFQVAALIEKLPPTWKDFKNYLKHKRKEMKLEDLIVKLRIEEDNRQSEKKTENEPRTYSEAMSSPEAPHWKEAINSEIESIMQNHTWELVWKICYFNSGPLNSWNDIRREHCPRERLTKQ
ncbi:hypothetical protein RJ639_020092 [Escallonia herrerae]|uniref:Uncharacterized protein n=1 Tax=Escallonia herrerae TaxID=1293975 RepID=A0AA89AK52_9ASTE|nr:hypothetical protein RJ639_020092 [Escallonia herrerae]